jgi:hypothetical protein
VGLDVRENSVELGLNALEEVLGDGVSGENVGGGVPKEGELGRDGVANRVGVVYAVGGVVWV